MKMSVTVSNVQPSFGVKISRQIICRRRCLPLVAAAALAIIAALRHRRPRAAAKAFVHLCCPLLLGLGHARGGRVVFFAGRVKDFLLIVIVICSCAPGCSRFAACTTLAYSSALLPLQLATKSRHRVQVLAALLVVLGGGA